MCQPDDVQGAAESPDARPFSSSRKKCRPAASLQDRDRESIFRSVHDELCEGVRRAGDELLAKIAVHSGVREHEARAAAVRRERRLDRANDLRCSPVGVLGSFRLNIARRVATLDP